mmetsp:Transcript_34651/g.79335  ORF Transcript_34651/g.79335 Transcript_34651/m.79335 type:complete len:598 (-) Transcript_34651:38-1831(-)
MGAAGNRTEELSAALRAAQGVGEEENACNDLRRCIPVEALLESKPTLWLFPEPPPAVEPEAPAAEVAAPKAKAGAKARPGSQEKAAAKGKAAPKKGGKKEEVVEEVKPEGLVAEPDRPGGGLFFSHTWHAPQDWESHFSLQPYMNAKMAQATSAVSRALSRGLVQGEVPRVWLDLVSLPPAVAPADHPLEQTTFGPCVLPLMELKKMVELAEPTSEWFSILRLDQGYSYQGQLRFRSYDAKGRPIVNTTPFEAEWSLAPGHYYVKTARVLSTVPVALLRQVMKKGWLPEDLVEHQLSPLEFQEEMQRRLEALEDMKLVQQGLTPDEAAGKEAFKGKGELLRAWYQKLRLTEEVWLEVTFGSVRSLCLLYAETQLASHAVMVAITTWNYFDRLWPVCEWAMFCCRRGPDAVQVGVDLWIGHTLVEFHRALRRLSVSAARCRDARDRDLLYGLLASMFRCTAAKAVTFKKEKEDQLTRAVHELALDFAPVERYIRCTAIAIFAKETALASKCQLGIPDEHGWGALAVEFGLQDLNSALKLCKTWDWLNASRAAASDRSAGEMASAIEEGYLERVQSWWSRSVLPVLEDERKLACCPMRR